LGANESANCDYKQVIRNLSKCFDEGMVEIDDKHFDKRVKLEGLTAI